jgi:hypothetical protein
MMARISPAYHRNVNLKNPRTHYRTSGSEHQIIFRSVLLGKKRNSINPLRLIGLR